MYFRVGPEILAKEKVVQRDFGLGFRFAVESVLTWL